MHERYADIVKILDPKGKFLGPADEAAIAKLEGLGLPESVLAFYRNYSPLETIKIYHPEEDIYFYPAFKIPSESSRFLAACEISPEGFIVFATSICGDAYCFDLNADALDPPVRLIGHEIMYEGSSVDDIREMSVSAADNFHQFFVNLFSGNLVTDPYHQ